MNRWAPQTRFGNKGPSKISQRAQLVSLIASASNLDALPTPSALAHMYRMDAKEVELLVIQERQRRERAA